MINHPADYLTDNYKTDTDSGNYKLLSIGHLEHLELLKAINDIELSRDIDEAYGFTLDKAGKNVLELRNGKDDELFRQSIKLKILSNLSAGTIEDLNAVCEVLFGDNFSYIKETWSFPDSGYEPGALILSVSSNPDSKSEFSDNMKSIILSSKAAGIAIYFYVCLNTYFHKNINEFIFRAFNVHGALQNGFAKGAVFDKLAIHAVINGEGLWAVLFNSMRRFDETWLFNQTKDYKLQERISGPYLSYSPQTVKNRFKCVVSKLVVYAAFFYWKRMPVFFNGRRRFDSTFLFDQMKPGLDFVSLNLSASAVNINSITGGLKCFGGNVLNSAVVSLEGFGFRAYTESENRTNVQVISFNAALQQDYSIKAALTKDSMYWFDNSVSFNGSRRFNAEIVKEDI